MKSSQQKNQPRSTSKRQLRVGELVRKALAQHLVRGDIPLNPEKNESIPWAMISVSEVRMTPDLKIATVYIAPLGEMDMEKIIHTLQSKEPLIRNKVLKDLHLKFAPRFKFVRDESYDNFKRIDELLKQTQASTDTAENLETDSRDAEHEG